ncbi:MAG: hypothetical protein AB1486_28135 [Planctomycetota bacterium]
MSDNSHEPLDDLSPDALRNSLREARQRHFVPPRADQPLATLTALRGYSRFMDELVLGVVRKAAGGELPDGWLLLATGGYGRLDLFPHSDVDVCILHRDPLSAPEREIVRTAFQALWDGGLRLSHAVRDLASCRLAVEAELATATALMEARALGGDTHLMQTFEREVIEPWIQRDAAKRLEQRLAEITRRYRYHGGSPLVKEPNVKEGVGGLRDYHASLWIERMLRLQGVLPEGSLFPWQGEHAPRAAAAVLRAVATLSAARIALHMVHGRQHDHLDLSSQLEVSRWLGIGDEEEHLGVEIFMRRYLLAAIELADLLESVIEERERLVRLRARPGPRREVGWSLVLVGDSLYAAGPRPFEGASGAVRAVQLFASAQRLHVRPARSALVAVREALSGGYPGLSNDPSVARVFLSIFEGQGNVGAILRAMHRCGLLGALIPEFGDLTGLVRFDPYHRYTVDEHSLRAVEEIDAIERGEAGSGTPRRVLDAVQHPALLKLALLLHDIGKARGHAHVERARVLVPGILARLGVPTDDGRLVLFLVDNHLLLYDTLQKGDPSDPGVLAKLAKAVRNPSRLGMLYLVTRADMAATSPAVFPRWQDALLTALFERCEAILTGERGDLLAGEKEIRARILEGIEDAAMRRRAAVHLATVTPRYLMEVDPEDVQLHLDLIGQLELARPVILHPTLHEDAVMCWVVAQDRPRLLTDICGAFAKARLSIVAADVYTREDGIALDRLRAVGGAGVTLASGLLWQEIERDITAAGRGELDLRAEIRRRGEPFAPGPSRPRYPAQVHFDNRISPRRTVIEVSGPDRRGLLFELAGGLAVRGIEIAFARIATIEGKASDTFYVHERGLKLVEARFAEVKRALLDVLERVPPQ